MKEIKREVYLHRLIESRENSMIKVITGIRRCGKSYLLFHIYKNYLIESGVDPNRILCITLDGDENEELKDPKALGKYIREHISEDGIWYLFLDEVQLCPHFETVLNGLNRIENLDIYVTGSNSKFLSSDIITEFRGRGDEIRVFPLSFSEYVSAYEGSVEEAWIDYTRYGGLPMILSFTTDERKSNYLYNLCSLLYFKDIEERHQRKGDEVMKTLLNILASSIGSLTNPLKLAHTFQSKGIPVTDKTISTYIDDFIDAFFIAKASRYDVKGTKYIGSPYKYYFTDVGLRNAQINFRQLEDTHLMENILFNELLFRGFDVDVGIVKKIEKGENNKQVRKQYEIDFLCNKGDERYYIQSAWAIPTREKMDQEQASLIRIDDSFKKIIVTKERTKPWKNEKGILILDVFEFLLNPDSLKL